jgi:heptosyltransferase-1
MPSILLVKTSSLGDVIHNLPVASDIQAKVPEAVIDWVVEEGLCALPRLHPGIRNVLPVSMRRWRGTLGAARTWHEMLAFRRTLRGLHYDVVLDSQGLLKSALIAHFAHGRRCGYAAEAAREALAARFYDATYVIPTNLHAVVRNRWLAAAALGYDGDLPLDYGVRSQPLSANWLPGRPYAVLLTATSRDDKLWPESGWLALAADLTHRGLACVLPAGSATERERAADLAARIEGAVAAPPLELPAIAALLSGAQLTIGVDTGLTHLAAALGRPTIALFCGSDPRLTGVFAGARALNLGAAGAPPPPADVIASVALVLS